MNDKNAHQSLPIEEPADKQAEKHADIKFNQERDIDCITVGRANVDMYPPDGDILERARLYNVFVGGSPANIAAGIAKQGLKAGIITRVAKDAHGEFVCNYLSSLFGIDTTQVQLDDSGASTSLAFAECRPDAKTIMYRNNAADLLLNAQEIDKDYIASAKSVFISGTALTQSPSRETIFRILEYAKAAGVVCAMDIDYRPYGWKNLEEASLVMGQVARECEIVIGTRDEFEVSGVPKHISDYACAEQLLLGKAKLVIIKRGASGSLGVWRNEQGKTESYEGLVYRVDAKKPYGAGDAFASSVISMLIKGSTVARAMRMGAASASINISGNSCTEAMPTEEEINLFISEYEERTNKAI